MTSILGVLCCLLQPPQTSWHYTILQDAEVTSLGLVEQLLACPASLHAVLHCGLSAEVQEAARSGSHAAQACMHAACLLFRLPPLCSRLHQDIYCDDDCPPEISARWLEVITSLSSFLLREETLPYLEPLCLPPDNGEPPHCALHAAQTCCCLLTNSNERRVQPCSSNMLRT
jgi:hypothetical protein